jgi:hypothetical protein
MSLQELKQQQKVNQSGQSITVRETPVAISWRCVHDGSNIIHLFKAEGATMTRNEMIAGTIASVLQRVRQLNVAHDNDMLQEIADGAEQNEKQIIENFINQNPAMGASRL